MTVSPRICVVVESVRSANFSLILKNVNEGTWGVFIEDSRIVPSAYHPRNPHSRLVTYKTSYHTLYRLAAACIEHGCVVFSCKLGDLTAAIMIPMDGVQDLPPAHREKLLEAIERMQARDR